jgi:superoxide dismutase, Fe-Mn family
MDTPTSAAEAAIGAFSREQSAPTLFTLQPLPYAESALEPVISARTLRLRYGKHYKGYVDTLNHLVAGTPFTDMTLAQIVLSAAKEPDYAAVFHNAAQAWHHAFYIRWGTGGAARTDIIIAQGRDERLATKKPRKRPTAAATPTACHGRSRT